MKNQKLNYRQSRPLRVMHFWGGVPQAPSSKWLRTLRLVEKCLEQGWESTMVFSERPQSPALINPFIDAGAEIRILPRLKSTLNIIDIIRTFLFLRRNPCDLIHCHNRPVVPLLAATFNKTSIRIWSKLSMSSSYEENKQPTGFHKLQLNMRISCFCSDKILCISHPVLGELRKLYKSVDKKALVGGVGFDLALYSSGLPKNICEDFSLAKNEFVIVTVGHAVHIKGWDLLLRAYSKFQKSYPESRLLLVGSTELKHEKETLKVITHLIEVLSLQSNVIITGKRNDIPDILSIADLYVQPSRSEGLCGALVEALAAGLPCIASNVGGIPDFLHCGENGLLFEREDINGLAENMLRIAQDKVLRDKLSKNAPASVHPYRIETVTDSIINTYQELFTNRGY